VHIAVHAVGSQITGVDLSSKMLAVLKERYPDVNTFCGDFLDYAPAQADAATATSGDDSSQQEQLQVSWTCELSL
jgi:trans-aconitate methyltransferase